ncbi:MAG: hypothetical protein HN576_09265 [Bacteriovoracaceae bacterium]|jgi:hypothetical protein|nr:hypothetical protein [Bacteriovoracaceae bacterium]
MALNIKPFFPLSHPLSGIGKNKDYKLMVTREVKQSGIETSLQQSDKSLTDEESEYIYNLKKKYYKKLLDVIK